MSIKLFFLVPTSPKNKIAKQSLTFLIKKKFSGFYSSNGTEFFDQFGHDFPALINNLNKTI